MKPPYEVVREKFTLPFPLRPYQIEAVNTLAPLKDSGNYSEPGTGKTAMATHHMLYWIAQQHTRLWLIVVPPILIQQWATWLMKIRERSSGKAPRVVVYEGTKAQRAKLSFERADFIVVSYGILKNDFARIYGHCRVYGAGVLADEATAIKNIQTMTHKLVAAISEGATRQLLTGTPINKPGDAYAYLKLLAAGVYRNQSHFERVHVAERDSYGNVAGWQNMDLLARNMKVNTVRILRREVRKELPDVIYTPVLYQLDKAHLNLYQRIAEERLLEFADGREIDAISAQALRSALQQIVVNWGEFDEDPAREPKVLDLIHEVLEELGEKKLVIVANFRRTNRYLLNVLRKPYGAVAIYGDVTASQKQAALREFIENPQCRVILLHPESAGLGIDGLQHVCSDMLIVEAPATPTPFQQVIARLDRDGQQDVVNVRVAIAQATVQVGMFKSLLEKDKLVCEVQGNYKSLRDSIFGDSNGT